MADVLDEKTGELAEPEIIEEPLSNDLANDFHRLNEIVLSARQSEIKWKFIQLRALYTIFKNNLWAQDRNYSTVNDWLGELYEQGVEYASTSTLYKKISVIDSYLALHDSFTRALLMAIKYDSLIDKGVAAGIFEIEKDGEGVNAIYEGRVTEKGKEVLGEGGLEGLSDVIARLPKGAANQYVNNSFGVPSIKITSLIPWTQALPFDIKGAPTLLGEVQLEDEEGATPYQFAIIIEKGVGKSVIEGVGRRMKSNMRLLK